MKMYELMPTDGTRKSFKCSISGEFADEDIGSNCGTFSIEDGECDIEPPEDPVRFALDMWDID